MKKKKKKILLVLGGNSKEREISFQTGSACYKAIIKLGYQVEKFDPRGKTFNSINKKKVDIIFNALHGKEGEDGIAQSHFEYLRVPYTHSGVISSMNAMNKIISKEIFKKHNIVTPKYFTLNKSEFSNDKLRINIIRFKLKFPIVIKPENEGSSIGVKICENYKKLKTESTHLLKKYERIIFEQFIGGKEIQVAVLNNKAIGAIELNPKRKFYDYKAKYFKSSKTEHIMPASISKKKYAEVMKIAQKTHKALNCRGVTRSDFKFYKNKFYILEINTQPGMTNLSLVPEIAKFKNISFTQLVKKIIDDSSINK